MKLSKTDPRTDNEGDMTPMIDIVFQLIIFFMLIMDMSEDTLEVLKLPPAKTASPDKPDPTQVRPVVNILSTGEIFVMGDKMYDPENPDDYQALMLYLTQQRRRMEEEPIDENDPNSKPVAADPILIRADQSTPFNYVQKVMEVCGRDGIQIWKVQLAAAEDGKDLENVKAGDE